MVDDERRLSPVQWGRQIGAREGTAFGLMVAGAVMGMAWLGGMFGSVKAIGEGNYALLFLGLGTAILLFSLRRREE